MPEFIEKTIDITPDKSIIPKIGKTGYSVPEAIAELIDNSIDAKLEEQSLLISVIILPEYIEISDNAIGMNEPELENAMRLAHSTKQNMLGEYGLGLKTSCLSLGKTFSISTTKNGDKNIYHVKYDEDKWMSKELTWKNFPMRITTKKDAKEHGTIIRIENLRVQITEGVKARVFKDISKRYAPYIKSNSVTIKLNKEKCSPEKIELNEDGKTNFSFEIDGNKVWGWYGLLKEASMKGYYGFTTFRRNRMITAYDKIGLEGGHPTLARIVGEIHIDFVPATHNKREFIKESSEYIKVELNLVEELKTLRRKAREKSRDEVIESPKLKEEMEIWKESILKSLQSSEIKSLLNTDIEKQLRLSRLKRVEKEGTLKDIEVERRDKPLVSVEVNPIPRNEKERTPKKTHKVKRFVINIKGKRYNFNHEFLHLGEESSWKEVKVSDKEGIEIFTNVDFPAFLATKDRAFYAVFHIAEGLSEIIIKELGQANSAASDLKQLILRGASEIKTQLVEKEEELRSQLVKSKKLEAIGVEVK